MMVGTSTAGPAETALLAPLASARQISPEVGPDHPLRPFGGWVCVTAPCRRQGASL